MGKGGMATPTALFRVHCRPWASVAYDGRGCLHTQVSNGIVLEPSGSVAAQSFCLLRIEGVVAFFMPTCIHSSPRGEDAGIQRESLPTRKVGRSNYTGPSVGFACHDMLARCADMLARCAVARSASRRPAQRMGGGGKKGSTCLSKAPPQPQLHDARPVFCVVRFVGLRFPLSGQTPGLWLVPMIDSG